jgi:hypothetical protein
MDNFPKEECTIQNKNESNVFDAETVYQVLYIDIRFPREKMITYAKPYICIDNETGEVLFGWTSIYTSQIFGNVENSCQFWNEFVVGFVRADAEYQESDVECFNKFKETIETQYDKD